MRCRKIIWKDGFRSEYHERKYLWNRLGYIHGRRRGHFVTTFWAKEWLLQNPDEPNDQNHPHHVFDFQLEKKT
jgi:hypothetical protein